MYIEAARKAGAIKMVICSAVEACFTQFGVLYVFTVRQMYPTHSAMDTRVSLAFVGGSSERDRHGAELLTVKAHLPTPPIANGMKYHVLVRTSWKVCKAVVQLKSTKATIAAALEG